MRSIRPHSPGNSNSFQSSAALSSSDGAHSEICSFHIGGANVVLADGSVHFLKAFVNINLVLRMVTRDRGEVIPSDAF